MDEGSTSERKNSELSAAEKSALMRAEKQRREEMFLVRMNFQEPQIERDRLPDWVKLLQKQKQEHTLVEREALQPARWYKLLDRQQCSARSADSDAEGDDALAPSGQFMSSWLRQLLSDAHESSSHKPNTSFSVE